MRSDRHRFLLIVVTWVVVIASVRWVTDLVRICTRNLASRLDGGSSNKHARRMTMARASATRCCRRPTIARELMLGRLSPSASVADALQSPQLVAREPPDHATLSKRQMREQRIVLKHETDIALVCGQAGDVPPAGRMLPASGCSNPRSSTNVVVLPHPDGPSKVRNSPRHVQMHVRAA
jgi:hypothetical protein